MKFAASRRIVKESWKILKQDKEMMYFSIMSMVITMLLAAGMAAIYYFVILGGGVEVGQVERYLALFVYYIVIFFVANFFEAGVITIAQGRIMGADLNFKDGMKGATESMGRIFIWSILSATVGLVLRIVSDKFKLVGRILAAIFGASWAVLTYFSLPALVVDKLGVMDAFRESSALIRKTWGETFLVKVEVGFFFFILFFVLMVPLLIIMLILPNAFTVIGLGVIGVMLLIAMSIVSATLNAIFKLVLYNYAKTGVVPAGFPPEIVQSAVGN